MATVQELLHEARDLPGDSARRDDEILPCHCLQLHLLPMCRP